MSAPALALALAHDCLDSLTTERSRHVETHGLYCGPYEQWDEEWEHCTVCGADYEPREVALMYRQRNQSEMAVSNGN